MVKLGIPVQFVNEKYANIYQQQKHKKNTPDDVMGSAHYKNVFIIMDFSLFRFNVEPHLFITRN